jgi:hypothetical protein
MNILNDSGIRKIDLDLVSYYFNLKSSTLEELEEHDSGTFSTQQKLQRIKGRLIDFLSAGKNKNSLFYVFFDEEKEENLKMVLSSVRDEPDEMTRRYAILINRSLTDIQIEQLSLSSKLLTVISNRNE